jgi:ribonuclease HI
LNSLVEVYIDGASAGDPGPSGAGIFIKHEGQVSRYSFYLGIMDNHEAEFLALVKGLEICVEKGYSIVSFRSDSQAVVAAVEKKYVKNKRYAAQLDRILALIDKLDLFFIKWISNQENRVADELARQGIRLKGEHNE